MMGEWWIQWEILTNGMRVKGGYWILICIMIISLLFWKNEEDTRYGIEEVREEKSERGKVMKVSDRRWGRNIFSVPSIFRNVYIIFHLSMLIYFGCWILGVAKIRVWLDGDICNSRHIGNFEQLMRCIKFIFSRGK